MNNLLLAQKEGFDLQVSLDQEFHTPVLFCGNSLSVELIGKLNKIFNALSKIIDLEYLHLNDIFVNNNKLISTLEPSERVFSSEFYLLFSCSSLKVASRYVKNLNVLFQNFTNYDARLHYDTFVSLLKSKTET